MNTTLEVELNDRVTSGRNAIVLGGSLAGFLAARVLSDHFDKVTIIERDTYPDSTVARRGVPHANHVHAMLLRGRQILEQLFPGLQDEMISAGAPLVDLANDVTWFTRAGWGVRFPSDLKVLAFTRPLLDLHVRHRLELNHKVRILENTSVVGLTHRDDEKRVTGVIITTNHNDSEHAVTKTLRADLVVDTTGRGSQAPRWLAEFGYPAPGETVVDAHLGYASRLYKIPKEFRGDWKCTIIQRAAPQRKRGGIMFSVEGNRWLLTLIGGARDYPPSDEIEFLEFARSLPVSTIYDAIKNAEPVSPIKTHRGTQNRLRHLEYPGHLPDNFLVLGDAACAFNPVYGQGMTVAAMGTLILDGVLRETDNVKGLSHRFQRQLANVNKGPWMMATSEDYRDKETEGGSPGLVSRFMHKYMDQVIKLSTKDVMTRNVLLHTFNLLVPPSVLFQHAIVFRVLRQLFLPGTTSPIESMNRRKPVTRTGVYQS
jgi:2-polyprenyl-6-methoxyphenol hydroxylase-like FAD-dependent oxidoreductase